MSEWVTELVAVFPFTVPTDELVAPKATHATVIVAAVVVKGPLERVVPDADGFAT